MVSLYPDGRNAKEREMGVRFQHVPFPCGKFLPFHTVCPEYEQTGTESVEKLSVQNPDQPLLQLTPVLLSALPWLLALLVAVALAVSFACAVHIVRNKQY